MIYIYNPGEMRDAIIEMLDAMNVDFTEDEKNAFVGIRKRMVAKSDFDYGKLRGYMASGIPFRQMTKKMGMTSGSVWRRMRLDPLEGIPEEHRQFFEEYRKLVDVKKAVARLTRGLCDELANQGVRELLGTGTKAPSGNLRRGRRSALRRVPKGKGASSGE